MELPSIGLAGGCSFAFGTSVRAHYRILDYLIREFLCFLDNLDENNICQLKKVVCIIIYLKF